jgi:hypothetical protein
MLIQVSTKKLKFLSSFFWLSRDLEIKTIANIFNRKTILLFYT